MHREPNEHPNYTRQKEEILAAAMAKDVVEEQGRRLKAQIEELLSGTGYSLDFDTWGGQGIVLRHFHQVNPNRPFGLLGGYDHQISFDKD